MKKLGFGMMRLPLTDKQDRGNIDQELVSRMADAFLENGFTYFDTAYPYHNGKSEAAAKRALVERHPREAFILADKMPVWLVTGSGDYQRLFDEQLARCGVRYFDYYLLHSLDEKSYAGTLRHGGFEFMKKLKAEGKAKRIGFSFHDKADVLDRILAEHPEMEFVQLQINYIDWESDSVESRKCYETAAARGKPVIVMEPVKGGALAKVPEEADKLFKSRRPDRSAASWAIRFAASLDNVITVLSGMSDMEQLMDNISCMRDFTPLCGEEKEIVRAAADSINAGAEVPCTACQYCVDGCPANIPIPQYLSLYNNQGLFGLSQLQLGQYLNLARSFGKASDCTGCGQCEGCCPQHIPIAEWMQKTAAVFEAGK